MDALKEWVDHHMKEKSSEDLWYLSEEILMELSGRDSIKYRIIEDKVEITHDTEGCKMPRMYSASGDVTVESRPKKTRQGRGKHTKYAASSRNLAKKRSRGQGK